MTGRIERNNASYSYVLDQLNLFGVDIARIPEMKRHYLEIRKECIGDLQIMGEIVDKLQPQQPYLTFGGAVEMPRGQFTYHSAGTSTLSGALLLIRAGVTGRFTVDGGANIVAAEQEALIPIISSYPRVIEAA